MKNQAMLKFDFNNMFAENVGKKEGFTKEHLKKMDKKIDDAYNFVLKNRGKGMMGWAELCYNQDEIVKDIVAAAQDVRKNFENFVVLGIGGSALGPMAVFTALKHLKYNDLDEEKRCGPKFFVEDNIDPERMQALLDVIDIKKTMFNVISKSGATSETMSQYLIIIDLLKKALGKDASKNIIATTDIACGNLIKIAKAENFKTFYIPDGVGGRFSELCPVGLLPAAVLGIDIKMLLKGAADMDKICMEKDINKNPALMGAVLQYLAVKAGKNISVMMPYADSLRLMSDWYCQLWGESLGKENDLQGNKVFAGQTPVKALGVTDQHSQVQLYTEGPFDKVITFLAVEKFRTTFEITRGCEDIPDVGFLGGHTLNELLDAERIATEYALTVKNRLNYTIYLPEVCEHTIGQLLYVLQMKTAYCGALLEIDAFNQPGVEEGKNATYALLGKAGYEKKKKEIENAPKKLQEYMM
ncbi:MAG: glucose-6-phosphate isomerase [Firmicutes bacterium]|nr:glucose-6-phosphate isomerase [Bacillota bacterium]